jgi:phosphoglycolate phosphatase-like HAD superfamily hydrolase
MPLPFTPAEIDAILFDIDGTLIDSDDADVSRWARRIARFTARPRQARTRARRVVMALETPVSSLFTLLDMVGLDTPVVRLIIALQGGLPMSGFPPITGMPDLLPRLAQRFKLATVSTRSIQEQERLLSAAGMRDAFPVLIGRDSTWRIKPHPQPVLAAARALGVDPRRCLMVGDTTVDMLAGRRAGAHTVGVLCGYGERDELERAGAEILIDSTAELSALLG